MKDQPENEHDLAPGESFRALQGQAASGNAGAPKPPKGVELDSVSLSNGLVRFLNETSPAKLLLWSAVFLILASVCGIGRVQLQSHLSWSQSQQFWDSAQTSISIPSQYDQANDRTGLVFIKNASGFALGVGAFIFGIIGGLLPMWAVGRLIADAIREGHTHE